MLNRFIKIFLYLFTAIALVYSSARPWGKLPPLGSMLNPFSGIWNRGIYAQKPFDLSGQEKFLKGPLRYQIDKDLVPHIFAANEEDAFFAQGFYVASQRLWQMDTLSRLAAGRLSEVMGSQTIDVDKFFIRMDLLGAAQKSTEQFKNDELTVTALTAYCRGVNAFIDKLNTHDLPFEFKLLGYRPERWSPLKTALILKLMTYNLAGHSDDLSRTRTYLALQKPALFEKLFPIKEDWIVPSISDEEFSAPSIERPKGPDPQVQLELFDKLKYFMPDIDNGSNSWVVGAAKSLSQHPLLANDTHLDLQIPSLWYQIQIATPEFNVMGVSLPGAPGIVVGFNQFISWGSTNGGSDVMDWYYIHFADHDKKTYWFDGQKKPLKIQERKIYVRGGLTQKLNLLFTHHGPLIYEDNARKGQLPRGLALKWLGHEGTNELKTFLLFNRAKSLQECKEAASYFVTPQQNFICADEEEIGFFPSGMIPRRGEGVGRFVMDGSVSSNDWQGFMSPTEIPYVMNPKKEFIQNANQRFYGNSYPLSLGDEYSQGYRGTRIDQVLRSKEKFAAQDFMALQNDSVALYAKRLTPLLISYLSDLKLVGAEANMIEDLKNWNGDMDQKSPLPVIFSKWFGLFEKSFWSLAIYGKDQKVPKQLKLPKTEVLIKILSGQAGYELHELKLDEQEVKDLTIKSFKSALALIEKDFGSREAWRQWRWGTYHPSTFSHPLKIPALGRKVASSGSSETVLANKGSHGPVWKMVVSLKHPIKAWGLLPGGQSGDPLSRWYASHLDEWSRGDLMPLRYFRQPVFFKEDLLLDLKMNEEQVK